MHQLHCLQPVLTPVNKVVGALDWVGWYGSLNLVLDIWGYPVHWVFSWKCIPHPLHVTNTSPFNQLTSCYKSLEVSSVGCTDVSRVFAPCWSWELKAFLCIFCCRIPMGSPSPHYAATPWSPWSTWERVSTCHSVITRMKSKSISNTVEQKTFVSIKATCWKEVRMEPESSYWLWQRRFFAKTLPWHQNDYSSAWSRYMHPGMFIPSASTLNLDLLSHDWKWGDNYFCNDGRRI